MVLRALRLKEHVVGTGNKGNVPVRSEDNLADLVQHGSSHKPGDCCVKRYSGIGLFACGKVANNLEMRYVTVGITTKAVQETH
jgi:hypothetical protein